MSGAGWRIRTDTGGTFTDGWAVDPDGVVHRAKVLSSSRLRAEVVARAGIGVAVIVRGNWIHAPNAAIGLQVRAVGAGPDEPGVRVAAARPHDGGRFAMLWTRTPIPDADELELSSPEPAPVLGARVLTNTPSPMPLPPGTLRLATTRATNALLERRGARVGLLTTAGFEDLERIGDQRRPDLFSRTIRRPDSLVACVQSVPARIGCDGTRVSPLDPADVDAAAAAFRAAGVDAVAVCFMHAARFPGDERAAAARLRELGFDLVSESAVVGAEGFVDRLRTVITDAFVAPVMREHLGAVRRAAGSLVSVSVVTSAGAVRPVERFAPVEGLLSGPAGGVAGAASVAAKAGIARAIGFDMGGTSTDVCRIDGDPVVRRDHQVGDGRVLIPAYAIETVAAGGGSIARWADGRLQVGPQSAGADPGPACHGSGGPLTVTDCALLLGRMVPERFPFPPNVAAAGAAADTILESVRRDPAGDPSMDRETLLAGFCDLAAESMADAIRTVTVREGWDPTDHAIVAFGGAGGQHACAVAQRLGVDRVVFPADASILSAVGLDLARVERRGRRELLTPFTADDAGVPGLAEAVETLTRGLADGLEADGIEAGRQVTLSRSAFVRPVGVNAAVELDLGIDGPVPPPVELDRAFRSAYQRIYGMLPIGRSLELESVSVRRGEPAVEPASGPPAIAAPDASPEDPPTRSVHLEGAWREVPVHERHDLSVGRTVEGPAIVIDDRTAALVHAGWSAEVLPGGDLLARRRGDVAIESVAEPAVVRRELTARRIRAIATDMGEQLRRTATSVNVRDRLDFSCGVLDPAGRLLASAPHVPVHLGALGACVRGVIAESRLDPGDVFVVNHPAFGGSHLPDITVVAPVDADDGARLGYVAARAHHAEIGGRRPGSMSPFARTLDEEGVVIPPMRLVSAGEDRSGDMLERLRGARYPSRAPDENLADLRAQVAACRLGIDGITALAARLGEDAFSADRDAITESTAELVRGALAALVPGDARVLEAADALDDGTPIRVRIELPGDPWRDRPRIDFTGSGDVHSGALNAPRAVTSAAVAYVMRLLVDRDVSLDDGLLESVKVVIPPGLLAPVFHAEAARCPAVAGGNVETSQRVVDVLVAAFGLGAASQGTMNNVLFGADQWGTYETIGGGAGATPDGPGAGGVHVHMTNTALTDPETLERVRPVRIERFGFRPGSGGAGAHAGGDGLERIYRFAEGVRVTVLGSRRGAGPPGAGGGGPGAAGEQWVERADGSREGLAGLAEVDLGPGDRLVVRTPGGGGWGQPGVHERDVASTERATDARNA